MNIPKIHSISKKILVALLGAFLCVFLLFHAGANLCILRHDGGEWYNAFCNFMGTNVIVKVFEIVLLATFLLHIGLALWLAITNKKARPVGYHEKTRSKTHKGSKLQVWTGILILVGLIVHFNDFYFVKMDLVEGKYMVEANNPVALSYGENHGTFSAKGNWLGNLNADDRAALEAEGLEVEPDFYNQAKDKFANPFTVIIYLVFFTVVWFHMRHGFAAAFQTLGLYNYKYGRILEVLGQIYAWAVCLAFTAVVLLVHFGF